MTRLYERAGLTPAEIQNLTDLIVAVWSADPTVPWVAVRRSDALGVVAVVDRLVDRSVAVVDRVTEDDQVMGGVPCIRGTRIPVVTLVGMLAAGLDVPAVLAHYPELSDVDVRAALEFAANAIEASR